ncbi:MAG: energy-coupling factor transporter transmembrane component T family protein [Promethearchaeota archaeon]
MSLQFLEAFKFLKKDSLIHELDPRAKFLFALTYAISALLFTEIMPLFIIFISILPIVLLGKMIKEWWKSVQGMSFLIFLIILLNTLFLSLNFALAMVLRIMIMLSAFSIFFLTVDPNDLALSLISIKIPYEYGFSFSLAFRFVPTIAMEAQNIIDAQKSRGYEMEQKGIINQIKNLFPLLIPLIICSIRRAFNVAEALESRAFGSKKRRTFYHEIKYTLKDWFFTSYLIFFLTCLIIIRINFSQMPSWLQWTLPL